jgi:deoxyadenosine/deoxycytidine kinase
MSKIYTIEGNIGSGKSTLIEKLKQYVNIYDIISEQFDDNKFFNVPKIIFVDEPVKDWMNLKDENNIDILTKFYQDTKKYAFPFQMMAYISRLSILKETIKKNPNSIIISERSIFTDKNVFAKMLYQDNMIEEINYQIYLKWFDNFIEDFPLHGIIYVNTEPTKCLERVHKRNRQGESLTLEYLEKCHCYHQVWLNNNNKLPTLTLDGNQDKNNNEYQDWINKIIAFIETQHHTLPLE